MGIAEASAEMVVPRRREVAPQPRQRLRLFGDALVRRLEDVIETDTPPPHSLLDDSRRFLFEVNLSLGLPPRRVNTRDPRLLLDRVFTAIEEVERCSDSGSAGAAD